jgi:hypothetical protein
MWFVVKLQRISPGLHIQSVVSQPGVSQDEITAYVTIVGFHGG